MKKLISNFKKVLLLVGLMIVTTTAWATVTQYTFTGYNFQTSQNAWTCTQRGNSYANSGVQCMTNYKGSAYTKSSFTNVHYIIVKYCTNSSSGAGNITIKIGSNTAQNFAVTSSGGTNARCAYFDYPTPQTGAITITGNTSTNSIYIMGVTIVHGTNSCNGIDVGASPIILPAGTESYTAFDWKNNGITATGYSEPTLWTIDDNDADYCTFTAFAYDNTGNASGLQCKAYCGFLLIHGITSAAGIKVEIGATAPSSAKGFTVELTGATTQTGKYTGTTTITTTSTNATLAIRKPTDGAGYISTIKISPLCTPPATDLAITNATATVTIGNTLTMTTNTGSGGGNGGTVSWSVTSGTGSASINSSTGVLTPSGAGTVTVKAHQDKNGDYCPQDAEKVITIEAAVVPVTSVSVDPTSKEIIVGETFTITPTISPGDATDKTVAWTSSATGKATVNSSGVVTGVAAGSATITCTTNDGGKTATCSVTVYGVTLQAKAKASIGDTPEAIVGGSPGSPTRTGVNISPAADANNYVFWQWEISGASLGSAATTKSNSITTPTGAVTVTAIYHKPISVTWKVNNTNYSAGTPTTEMGYGSHVTTLPTAPDPGDYCGNVFVGWTDEEYSGDSAPTHLYKTVSEFPNATGNQIFYAVFADYDD